VKIYAGAELSKHLTFGPPPAKSFRTEYGSLECTIQVVKSLGKSLLLFIVLHLSFIFERKNQMILFFFWRDVDEAVEHINRYGSSHTDAIVTENREWKQIMLLFRV